MNGAAGPGGASGNSGIQHCDKPMGALAVVEPQDYIMQALSRRGLQSPTSLIRLMVQQSNCFIVVDRGMGMQNLMQERDLAAVGELRPRAASWAQAAKWSRLTRPVSAASAVRGSVLAAATSHMLFALVERGGKVRSQHVTGKTFEGIKKALRENVSPNLRLSGSKKNRGRFKTPAVPEGFRPRGAGTDAASRD